MGTVSEFISNFSVGARSNLYEVTITDVGEKLKFVCKAAQVPGKTVGPIEVRYLAHTIKVAGDPVFDDWTITILHDEDNAIRKALDDWQKTIMENDTLNGAGAMGDYFREAKIKQLKRDGGEIAGGTYTLYNCWPSVIDPMDMGFENTDTITEYGVTFSYSHWMNE